MPEGKLWQQIHLFYRLDTVAPRLLRLRSGLWRCFTSVVGKSKEETGAYAHASTHEQHVVDNPKGNDAGRVHQRLQRLLGCGHVDPGTVLTATQHGKADAAAHRVLVKGVAD